MNKRLSIAVLAIVFSLAAASANAANYTFTTLGTLGGPEHETYSYGFSINNHGDIVGISNKYGTSDQHATLWSNGTITDLSSSLPDNGGYSQAWMINDAGQIVGYGQGPGDVTTRGFLYSNGTMTTLPVFGTQDYSEATAIDPQGNVYGRLMSPYDPTYYPDGIGYYGNVKWNINGQISTVNNVPVSPSVNSYGASVGLKEVGRDVNGDSIFNAWLYSSPTDHIGINLNSVLDTSARSDGWVLWHGMGINNLGQIVGYGYKMDSSNSVSQIRGFVLSPVPEADTSAMLLMGAGLMGFMARRRKQAAA